ncbi:MAG: aldose epimerase family protein [Opitutaceae bacterium]|jgi:aldose 1-epimerase
MSIATSNLSAAPAGSITQKPFGTTRDGVAADLFTLRNANGIEARITNYGGIVTHLFAPDRNGKMGDVVLGYDNLAGYEKATPYFGALIGRYGNRIANGRFTLDGKTYTLAVNNGANSLHGGLKGFDKVVWTARPIPGDEPALELSYLSKDGEEGYPGNLKVIAVYRLTKDNALKLDFTATTDKPTVVNLTHHSYFNLACKGDILSHEVMINADAFTPVDSGLIPTGELRPVKGTPFDFTESTVVGARIDGTDEQLKLGGGYDHNWVLKKDRAGECSFAARAYEPTSGRVLEVETTEPAVQFYCGNFLDGTITGKYSQVYQRRNGLCFEPQHSPDSPNQPKFPSVILRPGQVFKTTMIYRLSVRSRE